MPAQSQTPKTTADQILNAVADSLAKYKKPVSLHAPCFIGNEWQYVKECLDTRWVSSVGSYVDKFEKDLAACTGAKHCIATVNGTAALHTALMLAGVKASDEVLVPTLT